jgi:hypothetical protein
MTSRRGRDLGQRITAAAATGQPALTSLVTRPRTDQDAVTTR